MSVNMREFGKLKGRMIKAYKTCDDDAIAQAWSDYAAMVNHMDIDDAPDILNGVDLTKYARRNTSCHFRCKNPHDRTYVVRGTSAAIPEIVVCHNCYSRICGKCIRKSIADNHKDEYAAIGYSPVYEHCDCQNIEV